MERFGIDSLSPTRAAATYAMMSLNYEPGTQYLYSNVGVNIGSAVVERVSGQSFDEFMKKRIFEPLGMKETAYVPTSEQVERIAKSYRYDNEKKSLQETKIHYLTYPLDNPQIRYAEAGGGIFSTAPEIVRFFQMLANDGEFQGKRILSAKSVEEMRTKQTGNLDASYGLGLGLFDDFYGHGGAYGNEAIIHKPTGFITIYMVQVTGVPKQGEAKEQCQKAILKEMEKLK
jgi:CubicO group peptidase (beta-lactamase class C family)